MKMTLKQLTDLFAQTAGNEEAPAPIRQFAAQLAVMTRHIGLLNGKVKEFESHIAELATAIVAVKTGTPTSSQAPAEQTATTEVPQDEDEAAKAMAEEAVRETEAEVAALAAKTQAVTPIRKANSNPTPAQEAS